MLAQNVLQRRMFCSWIIQSLYRPARSCCALFWRDEHRVLALRVLGFARLVCVVLSVTGPSAATCVCGCVCVCISDGVTAPRTPNNGCYAMTAGCKAWCCATCLHGVISLQAGQVSLAIVGTCAGALGSGFALYAYKRRVRYSKGNLFVRWGAVRSCPCTLFTFCSALPSLLTFGLAEDSYGWADCLGLLSRALVMVRHIVMVCVGVRKMCLFRCILPGVERAWN